MNVFALREFILGCSIDSLPSMTVFCRAKFGLSFDVFLDTSFPESFEFLDMHWIHIFPKLCSVCFFVTEPKIHSLKER